MSVASPIFLNGRVQEELIPEEGGDASIPAAFGRNTGVVVFFVQPNISESGTAQYTEIGDIRQPASLLIYMGSPSRTFSIDATFVSRTQAEAEQNLRYVNILRSWRMPEGTSGDGELAVKSPSRLFLWGLNNQFKGISVRMTDLNITLNDETDYITTPKGAVPIVWNVSITLKEARSMRELEQFSIQQFREGELFGW